MSILHTINKSPFERNSLESCLKFASRGDPILLYEDGVYAVLRGTSVEGQIKAALENQSIYVLGPDLKARGFAESRIVEGVKVVDYSGFVDLTADHDKVQAWL